MAEDLIMHVWYVNVMLCAVWYHLCNLKNVRYTHRGLLLLKYSSTQVFFFFKLYKWYQIAQASHVISLFLPFFPIIPMFIEVRETGYDVGCATPPLQRRLVEYFPKKVNFCRNPDLLFELASWHFLLFLF